jgi:hypothetical protein
LLPRAFVLLPVFAGLLFLFEHLPHFVEPHVFREALLANSGDTERDTRQSDREEKGDEHCLLIGMSGCDCSTYAEKDDMAERSYRRESHLCLFFGKNDDEKKTENAKDGDATVLLKEHGLFSW